MRPVWLERAARLVRPTRRERELRRLAALTGRRGAGKPIAVVYGNCQAGPLSTLLSRSPSFTDGYELVRIPPAHELTGAEAQRVRAALPGVELLVTQQIKAGYRGLPIGTDQFADLLPASARVLRYPVMYWEGAYPFQIYVRTTGELSQAAPVTDYADLRFLAFAARGLRLVDAERALREYSPPVDALRAQHERSVSELASRERSLDVAASDLLTGPGEGSPRFHTVNHPANAVLEPVASRILERLGLGAATPASDPSPEFLARLLSPVLSETADALGTTWTPRGEWRIGDRDVAEADVLAAHYRWFERDPEVVRRGAVQHRERIERFALG